MNSPIAALIDHTLLVPEATHADVDALVAEAIELGTYSVCVSPSQLPVTVPAGVELKVAVVCGFPSGKHTVGVKTAEARESVALGADEIDMVIDIGLAKEGRFDLVEAEIASVRSVVTAPRVLKVIMESAVLSDEEIVAVTNAAVAAGADFVKTSTGFHPAGGASEHAVALMKRTADGAAQVKASGGIRSLAAARAMVAAGATRLGLSASRRILAEQDGAAAAGDAPGSY